MQFRLHMKQNSLFWLKLFCYVFLVSDEILLIPYHITQIKNHMGGHMLSEK